MSALDKTEEVTLKIFNFQVSMGIDNGHHLMRLNAMRGSKGGPVSPAGLDCEEALGEGCQGMDLCGLGSVCA